MARKYKGMSRQLKIAAAVQTTIVAVGVAVAVYLTQDCDGGLDVHEAPGLLPPQRDTDGDGRFDVRTVHLVDNQTSELEGVVEFFDMDENGTPESVEVTAYMTDGSSEVCHLTYGLDNPAGYLSACRQEHDIR